MSALACIAAGFAGTHACIRAKSSLPEAEVPYEHLVDPYGIAFWPTFKGRDGCRTPMPWTDEAHGGFTPAEVTPLPVPAQHDRCAAGQRENAASLFKLTQRLLSFRRQHPALHSAQYRVSEMTDILRLSARC